jgi:hypothetical protein
MAASAVLAFAAGVCIYLLVPHRAVPNVPPASSGALRLTPKGYDGEPKTRKSPGRDEKTQDGSASIQRRATDPSVAGPLSTTSRPQGQPAGADDDYRQHDAKIPDLHLVGMPVQAGDQRSLAFRPSDQDRQRLQEIEAELLDAASKGLLIPIQKPGYISVQLQPGKTAYVQPGFEPAYRALLEEDRATHDRSMRPSETSRVYNIAASRALGLPDGTRLEYYRRRDGSLVRSVKKPDGSVRKWVIGWADVSRYDAAQFGDLWRDE